jgi:hypothetical protein
MEVELRPQIPKGRVTIANVGSVRWNDHPLGERERRAENHIEVAQVETLYGAGVKRSIGTEITLGTGKTLHKR